MAEQSKQTRTDQPRANLDGNTSRHTYNTPPASHSQTGGGQISPNSHNRGKQG